MIITKPGIYKTIKIKETSTFKHMGLRVPKGIIIKVTRDKHGDLQCGSYNITGDCPVELVREFEGG